MKVCKIDNCGKIVLAKGYCAAHYKRHTRGVSDEEMAQPLRRTKQVTIGTLRVDPEVAEELQRLGAPSLLQAARMVVDQWHEQVKRFREGEQ